MSGKQLFVVENHKQLAWLQHRTWLRTEPVHSILALYDFSLSNVIQATGVRQVILPERYLPPRAIDQIDTLAYELSDKWFRLDGCDPTEYEGVSLGRVLKIYTFFLFKSWMSEIEMLSNCIDDLKPERVVFLSRRRLFAELARALVQSSSFQLLDAEPSARRVAQTLYYAPGLAYLRAYLRLVRHRRVGLREDSREQDAPQVALVYEKGSGVLRLIHEFMAQNGPGPIQGVVADDPRLRQRLAEHQIAAHPLACELDTGGVEALRKAMFLERTWRQIAPRLSLMYRGIRFNRDEHRLESLWKHDGFRWLVYQDAVARHYEQTPSLRIVVMLQDVWPLSKLFALVGRRYRARTLVVQHGVTLDKPYYKIAYLPLSSDHIAVWGEESGRYFAAHGVEPTCITATGSPIFDRLAQVPAQLDRVQVCNTYHLDPTKRIVLYASQNFSEDKKKRVSLSILRGVSGLDEVELIVKLHPAPRDNVAFYQAILMQEGIDPAVVHILKEADLYALLLVCDVLVTVHSTVHVEAALLDKDILIVNLDGDAPLPIVSYEAALTASRPEEVAASLRHILFDPVTRQRLAANRRVFVEKYAFANDGQSTHRVASLIADLAP